MKSMYVNFNKLVFLDGAMGTMLQRAGLKAGDIPEELNMTHPEIIREIHEKYIQAGADIITTNTFGACELKLKGSKYTVEDIITRAVELARQAAGEERLVALDIGPIGQLLEPLGSLGFEEAYNIFARQVKAGKEAGADIILIETMADIYEARAAVLAAQENCNLPVFCTMTFQENGRTLTGTDPVTAVNILQGLGVDALGINCSVGPKDMIKVVKEMASCSKVPVIVQPNAGMPKLVEGETTFDVKQDEFIRCMREIVELGASVIGGCCGTSPEFIKGLKSALGDLAPKKCCVKPTTAVSSSRKTVFLGLDVNVIGERINPTGKKKFKEALRNNDIDYILNEAINQKEAGADILDVNVGLPEIDEKAVMVEVVKKVQSIVDLPLQIDSTSPEVIEAAVRIYNGRPIINSVNGEEKSMKAIFPIVKKYGASVIGLTLDEGGIPPTAEERFEIAKKIVNTALDYGIPKERIIIDCLVLTASAQQKEVMETVKAVAMVKEKLGVLTALGVSNVSFGLPNRELINRAFLTLALGAGLDAPILNPMDVEMMAAIDAYRVLANKDLEGKDYIELYGNAAAARTLDSTVKASSVPARVQKDTAELSGAAADNDLITVVIKGLKVEAAIKTKELLKNIEPLQVVDGYLIPALEQVGKRYEIGDIFLPQLIQSAEAVKSSFDVIKEYIAKSGEEQISKGRILLATVKGDVHDIGKNIVKVLLENYGFEVVDMGKDVAAEDIVSTVIKEDIRLIGLSALMTTSVKSMENTIKMLREASPHSKIMVGGAVLNQEYADMIRADYYAKDAQDGVRIARSIFA
jgi:5-methyltetrahydrofolate--homocysteine methyltransferase